MCDSMSAVSSTHFPVPCRNRLNRGERTVADAIAAGARSYRRTPHDQAEVRPGGFKFAVYVSVPIFLTVTFAANPVNLESIIRRHAYVVYPPEGPKPPTAAEMRKIVEANKKKRLRD